MRVVTAVLMLALEPTLAIAAPARSALDVALHAGDWRKAAELGASASDVVRAAQARGQFADLKPAEAVVTIGPDNRLDAVALKPLPPLGPAGADAGTANLSGSGFAFGAGRGAIILYPAFAQASFAAERPALTDRSRP